MNIEQMKKILADAPDGATHYCHEYLIANDDGWKWWEECALRFVKETSVSWATTRAGLHNLSNLRTIVNQHEEIERLRERVVELEDALGELQRAANRAGLRMIKAGLVSDFEKLDAVLCSFPPQPPNENTNERD